MFLFPKPCFCWGTRYFGSAAIYVSSSSPSKSHPQTPAKLQRRKEAWPPVRLGFEDEDPQWKESDTKDSRKRCAINQRDKRVKTPGTLNTQNAKQTASLTTVALWPSYLKILYVKYRLTLEVSFNLAALVLLDPSQGQPGDSYQRYPKTRKVSIDLSIFTSNFESKQERIWKVLRIIGGRSSIWMCLQLEQKRKKESQSEGPLIQANENIKNPRKSSGTHLGHTNLQLPTPPNNSLTSEQKSQHPLALASAQWQSPRSVWSTRGSGVRPRFVPMHKL